MTVRVRFAPSPTGYLHIGGARTALFNWLYARRNQGAFILRIEDTDAERSSWDMVEGITQGLRWLGLDWDEGPDLGGPHAPYFQSERRERYHAMAEWLVKEGTAYRCYCSPELLKDKRQYAEEQGLVWKYDRACCNLTPDRIARLEAERVPNAIRFKVPTGNTAFLDLVHGPIQFDNDTLEDFVILRSDSYPTYQLSVVVDDIEMGITHVVRGDDHVSNTPKQLLLYEAFRATPPRFAHVPLILGPDKKRLSKRHGATSVMEYERAGYLPEAMVNFLALLGWSPGTDRELFSREELIEVFSLEGISGGNPVFNPEKLDWFNQQHINRQPSEQIARRIEPILRARDLWRTGFDADQREWLLSVIDLLKPRCRRLTDFADQGRVFFQEGSVDYDAAAVRKHLGAPDLRAHILSLRAVLERLAPFERHSLEQALRTVAESRGLKAGTLIHATRVAVTGQAVSPGLFEVLELLGRERTLARLDDLADYLARAHAGIETGRGPF